MSGSDPHTMIRRFILVAVKLGFWFFASDNEARSSWGELISIRALEPEDELSKPLPLVSNQALLQHLVLY